MPSTFSSESLFGGSGPARTVNPPSGTANQTVATPGNPGRWNNLPVLPGIAASTGMSVPMLIAIGVIAWYLFRVY